MLASVRYLWPVKEYLVLALTGCEGPGDKGLFGWGSVCSSHSVCSMMLEHLRSQCRKPEAMV